MHVFSPSVVFFYAEIVARTEFSQGKMLLYEHYTYAYYHHRKKKKEEAYVCYEV
jgi:hypothetical protein